MIDVLYILGNGSKWGNGELRYSLRSLEKYATNVRNVHVVGENPKFLTDKVIYTRVPEAKGPKEFRIAAKIAWACEHIPTLSDDFLFMNDDHILCAPVDVTTYPFYYKSDFSDDKKLSSKYLSGYQRALRDTRDALRAGGHTTLHFDVHTPIAYNRSAFLSLREWWDRSRKTTNGFVVKSVYCNVLEVEPRAKISDCKITLCKGEDEVRYRAHGRNVFSFGDHSIARGVASYLAKEFPKKSQFEQ